MTANGRPLAPEPPPAAGASPPPRMARRIAVVTLGLLLLPVLSAWLVFPLFSQSPFASADEIDPDRVKWLTVQLLNRAELDKGEDVFRFTAAREDYPPLLAPLKGATEVPGGFTEQARGPYFGEYRMRTTDGRPGRVRLYWHRRPQDGPDVPARLRFEIGGRWFEGGPARAVVAAVDAATK